MSGKEGNLIVERQSIYHKFITTLIRLDYIWRLLYWWPVPKFFHCIGLRKNWKSRRWLRRRFWRGQENYWLPIVTCYSVMDRRLSSDGLQDLYSNEQWNCHYPYGTRHPLTLDWSRRMGIRLFRKSHSNGRAKAFWKR